MTSISIETYVHDLQGDIYFVKYDGLFRFYIKFILVEFPW